MKRAEKVVLLGIDGLDFKILLPLIREGKLPNFTKVIKRGVALPLKSTLPFHSAPAWTSMTTGVKPENHGIFHFQKLVNGKEKFVSRYDRRTPALWNLLSQEGLKNIVINVPVTYPPEEINGILISGGVLAPRERNFVYPKELREKILQRGYIIHPRHVSHTTTYFRPNQLVKEISHVTKRRMKVALELMKEEPWNFFMVVLRSFDFLIHKTYPILLDPSHPYSDRIGARLFGKVFEEYCNTLDEVLGELLKKIDKKTHLLIASDHGLSPIHRFISPLPVLKELDLLKFKEKERERIWQSLKREGKDAIYRTLSKINLLTLVRSQIAKIQKKTNVKTEGAGRSYLEAIDLESSKVIPYGRQMLLIRGENEEDASEIIPKVKRTFSSLRDPKTGKKPVKNMHVMKDPITREVGNYLLLMEKRPEYAFYNRGRYVKFRTSLSGRHGRYGIFIGWGKRFKNQKLGKAFPIIWDVAPTVLSLLDLEVPKWMNGKSLV